MEPLFDFFSKYVDFKFALLIVVSSYWAKKFLLKVLPKIDMAHKVLIFSTILGVMYYMLLQRTGVVDENSLPAYLISYFIATSFYELAFAPMERAIKKFFGIKGDEE